MKTQTSKINVVLLTDCLGDITGGAEKQIFELAKRLPKDQYCVYVASMEAQGTTSRELIESIGCRLCIFKVRRIYDFSGLLQGIKFFHFLRQKRIHTLMTYHFGSDIWGAFWGHWAGVPSIISNRRDMAFWRKKSQLAAYRLIKGWVHQIVAVSASIKQMVVDAEGVKPDKIKVIYNGVEMPPEANRLQLRAELGIQPQDIVILHTANIRPVKGHRFLIEAFAQIAKDFPSATLVLAGKDELNGQLQEQGRKLRVEGRILFLGQRTDVHRWLGVADIGVLPSLSEGLSNAILEYMSYGLPVLATNVGGNPEVVEHGYNGVLVQEANSGQLAQGLRELLKDTNKRLTLGNNGRLTIQKKFSMQAMMDAYQRLTAIKVLHLISSAGLFGAERVVLTLGVQKAGIESWVGAIHNRHNPHLEIIHEAKSQGIQTVVFDAQGPVDMRTVFSLRKFLKENHIQLLHTHNYKSDITGFLATRGLPVRWVATNHTWHSSDWKMRFYETLDAMVLQSAQKIFAVSEEIKERMMGIGFKDHHVKVIHNGIMVKQFAVKGSRGALRSQWNVGQEDVLMAIVGRLAPEKGHKVLFQGLKEIVAPLPDVKCLVVGDGPLREELRKYVDQLGLSRHVIFAGIRRDMASVYAACDLLVNVSTIEGLPMTILEAMASGIPVVATAVGAVPRVVKHKKTGLILSSPHDPHLLAKTLRALIQNPHLRRRMGEDALLHVQEQFSDQIMFKQYQQSYHTVVNAL